MTEPGRERQAHQQFALRHLERLADGACGPRPVLLRATRERNRDLPSDCRPTDREISASAATASTDSARRRSIGGCKAATAERFRARRSMPRPIRRTIRSAGSPITGRWRATACRAPHATAWCSARTPPPSTRTSRRTPACSERQEALNPGLTGFAKSFTGSFLVGPPDKLYGPFQDPKKIPMRRAIGSDPAHSAHIMTSEVCGSCHTVHLPVLHRGKTIGHTYEQTTYPEWAFSDYRTGTTPDGPLPLGRGARAQSCQDCHMPSKSADGSTLSQQDRVDPGVQQLSADRTDPAARRDRPAGAKRRQQAHARRAQHLSGEDGAAVRRHPGTATGRSDAGRHRRRPDRHTPKPPSSNRRSRTPRPSRSTRSGSRTRR